MQLANLNKDDEGVEISKPDTYASEIQYVPHGFSYWYRMGNKVKNTFKILKKLGEGTYGAVYLVKDLTGNKYAFKLPTTDDAQDELTNEEEILEEINCKEGFSCIAGVTIIPELSNRPGLLSKYIDSF